MQNIPLAALITAFILASPAAFAGDARDDANKNNVASPASDNTIRIWRRLQDAAQGRRKDLKRPSWAVTLPGRPDRPIRVERIQAPPRPGLIRPGERPHALDRPHVLDRPDALDRPHAAHRQ